MATLTTLSAAAGLNDQTVLLASLTNLQAGNLIAIDKEIVKVLSVPAAATTPVPVLRGQEGSANAVHPTGAQARIGATVTNLTAAAPDFPQPAAGAPSLTLLGGTYTREVISYSANGAITLPRMGSDMIAMLNGTAALAMTLANPSVEIDGSFLHIIANGRAAHTVTYTAGVGNGGGTMDIGTYNATEATACSLVASGGFWVLIANGIGSAGTQVAGVVWA